MRYALEQHKIKPLRGAACSAGLWVPTAAASRRRCFLPFCVCAFPCCMVLGFGACSLRALTSRLPHGACWVLQGGARLLVPRRIWRNTLVPACTCWFIYALPCVPSRCLPRRLMRAVRALQGLRVRPGPPAGRVQLHVQAGRALLLLASTFRRHLAECGCCLMICCPGQVSERPCLFPFCLVVLRTCRQPEDLTTLHAGRRADASCAKMRLCAFPPVAVRSSCFMPC